MNVVYAPAAGLVVVHVLSDSRDSKDKVTARKTLGKHSLGSKNFGQYHLNNSAFPKICFSCQLENAKPEWEN